MAKKYIDAEKLIAEIERYIKHYEKLNRDEFKNGELYICQELLSFIKSLQQEHPEPTCKSCGFYENNCPFIRNTFKPYPNKFCKDYTYSVMKKQEQPEVDLKKEIKEWADLMVGASFPEQDGDFISEEDYRSVIRQTAIHFLGLNARKV